MKRKALGRGLSALIPEAPAAKDDDQPKEYFLCPIERIRPNRDQPRKTFDEDRMAELVGSVREQGVIQPLVVRPTAGGDFELVAGERRWRAAQKAGLRRVAVVVRQLDDRQALEMALVENLQREDLNPLEEADAMAALLREHDYTQGKLATRLGRDRSTVANTLRLLKLPSTARRALVEGRISAGHARALLGLDDPSTMAEVLSAVLEKRLSVRQTEALVKRLRQAPAEADEPKKPKISANLRDLQDRLSRSLQTRVQLRTKDNRRGRIEIAYSSLDELDRLLERLMPK